MSFLNPRRVDECGAQRMRRTLRSWCYMDMGLFIFLMIRKYVICLFQKSSIELCVFMIVGGSKDILENIM